jgi:beta-galactosidase
MLVIDEAFDMWEKPKNPMDYSLYFKEHWKGDLESMILRDRNHPSVIIWSIGNEINERADTSGQRIAKNLSETVKALDNTRPITAAICMFWDHPGMDWTASPPAFAHLDIGGYNYQWGEYENDHKKFPERIMMGTESFPVYAFENWQHVEKDTWVIGDFVWTGMDYLGESGIGHVYLDKKDAAFTMLWPWYNSWCGDIDICGQKKAQSYYRDVVWKRSMLEMAVHSPVPEGKKEGVSLWGWPSEYQSWTWPGAEGKPLQVSVYSRCPSVRLELNGKVIGEKKINTDPMIQPRSFAEMMSGSGSKLQLTATFDVPYASGELKAIGIVDGKEVATKILTSAGKPASIRLTPDRGTIRANRNDLAYVTIEITDDSGNLVPNAEVPVQISVTGDGELQASGNAAPNDMKSFRKAKCVTFQGRCLAIVRPFTHEGSINLSVSAEGLPAQNIAIKTNQSGK